jgi:outer membrane receptor protein involved in Fe transport
LALALGATAASAQTVASPDDKASQAASESVGLPEVVVTAQKRSEILNNVGLAVTALSAQKLADQKIVSLNDVAQSVPGLSLSSGVTGTPVFTLRGIGFFDRSLAATPAVSSYVDEAPLPYSALAAQTAFDLERIEVLKGPQGTLFGQNSTGGAINFIAAKPTREFTAGGDLSYGRFNTVETNAYVSGPLTDTLAARFSAHAIHSDDRVKSYLRDDHIGKQEAYAARLLLDWEPNQDVRFQLNVNGWKDKTDPIIEQYIGLILQYKYPNQESIVPGFYQPMAPDDARRAEWTPELRPYADNRFWQGALRSDINLPHGLTLTSLTSYIDYKQDMRPGGDGLTASASDIIYDRGSVKAVSQELRVSNGGEARLRWVVGGNYSHDKVFEDVPLYFPGTSQIAVLGGYNLGITGRLKSTTYAAFANGEYGLTDSVTLKAGARYTHADRSGAVCTFDLDPAALVIGDNSTVHPGSGVYNDIFTGVGRSFPGNENRPALKTGDCFTILADNYAGPPVKTALAEENVSWRVGVDWKPSTDSLIYANIAKGYKAGAIEVAQAAFASQLEPAKQESLLSYETGFKVTLLERRLQLNGSVFYYDYRDKQINSKVNDPQFAIIDKLVNIPKSEVKGAELELTAAPISGLIIGANINYYDAKITDFIGLNGAGQVKNFAGKRIPFVPKVQIGLNADYHWKLDTQWSPFVGAGVTYRSKAYSIVGGEDPIFLDRTAKPNPFLLDAYTLVDLRAGLESSDGKYRVMVWGKNVFDEFYSLSTILHYDSIGRFAGQGATYGVTIGAKF